MTLEIIKKHNLKKLSLRNNNMENITNQLFPHKLESVISMYKKYPKRILPKGAMVTRIAPSPTGFFHIGGLYMALISERFAHQTKGVYYLRIEDTDKKREIEGARKIISISLCKYGLSPDEGEGLGGIERGIYGPYCQSDRKEIYKVFIKHLVEIGRAYPCFCSQSELDEMRKMQEEAKVRTGYYGIWAKWRDADKNLVKEMLDNNKEFVIRFKSTGDYKKSFSYKDLLKCSIEFPENDIDTVIMKSDGLPTYHLAHVIDDHLMSTTHVLRGDEWISSIPLHYELFNTLELEPPLYGHISPINKIDEYGHRRKLSKRKDPEANVIYYDQKGYPRIAIIEYLMNLANSDFEDWRNKNPTSHYTEFTLTFKKLAASAGPLFDEAKLRDISKELIAKMTATEIYEDVVNWSSEYDSKFKDVLLSDKKYWVNAFSIERSIKKTRKDIACWSEIKRFFYFLIKEEFAKPDWLKFNSPLSKNEISDILLQYSAEFSINDLQDEWMNKIRRIAIKFNFAPNAITFKDNKDKYRGHVGDIAQIIRYAITDRTQTPDLYQIIQVLGEQECARRISFGRNFD
ncbi:MAG: glutamyl-tRNA synthetase [Parcubacteria group bacterium Athens1014_10]|nr:MAG: glutamyl-tRNA synthetase [Parcubacteria group bacterium Athens1014_10]TSD04795.1 MAG: glutamyl-tRNA synthetase [Parcubacteria group bacterium Athens0714_12]